MIKQLILEEVYGNIIVAYHRTKVEDIIDKVYDTGWIPKDGDFYGKGFYGTFTLQSQLRDNMKDQYGPVIGKFRIDINNFVIFEWDVFQKTKMREYPKANENNFIELQLRKYGIIKTQDDIDELYNTIRYAKNSSDIAYHFFNLRTPNIKHVDGIIFHGANDGDVIVCFDLSLIHPLGYSTDDGKTFIKPNEFNKQYHNKRFKNKYIDPNGKITNANITKGDILIIIDKNPSLAKMYPNIMDDMWRKEWTDFYYKNPKLIEKYPQGIDKLSPGNLLEIVIRHPNTIHLFWYKINEMFDYANWERLYNNIELARYYYPQGLQYVRPTVLADYYLNDNRLLDVYPEGVKKLSNFYLAELCGKIPSFIEKFNIDITELDSPSLRFLLVLKPELVEKYPESLDKLNKYDLSELLRTHPILLDKYPKYMFELPSRDLAMIIRKRTEILHNNIDTFNKLSPLHWAYIYAYNPDFINKYPEHLSEMSSPDLYEMYNYSINPDVIYNYPEGILKLHGTYIKDLASSVNGFSIVFRNYFKSLSPETLKYLYDTTRFFDGFDEEDLEVLIEYQPVLKQIIRGS